MRHLTPEQPHVIVVVGIPGAGKSTFASHFSEAFKTPYINQTDFIRQSDANEEQAALFTQTLFDELAKTRRTFIYEGSTETVEQRDALVRYIMNYKYQPVFVWVQTHPDEAGRRATLPYPKGSGLTFDEHLALSDAFEWPLAREKAVVISGRHTFATQVKAVLRHLASKRPSPRIPSRESTPPPPRRNLLQ